MIDADEDAMSDNFDPRQLDAHRHSEDALRRARDAERPRHDAEFGPSGYLPKRAASRARKIVLRAPLGLQWVVAALVLGGVVLVAGGLLLTRVGQPPQAPYVAAGAPPAINEARVVEELDVLLVSVGRVRAFTDADELGLTYNASEGRIEGSDGQMWSVTGRAFGDGTSLDEHPSVIHEDALYVDPTRTTPAPPPDR